MDETNAPGVGPVLTVAGLAAVPEAHCYLIYDGTRVDLTWPEQVGALLPFMWEEAIRPEQIGDYKLARHRAFVGSWSAERRLDAGLVWSTREACIAALGSL